MDLAGRSVLVTGASRGLGAAFVDVCLDAGAEVVHAGARDLGAIAARERVVPVELDVTDADQVGAVAAALPHLDLLVSNAGVPCFGPALEPAACLREAFEVNAFGPLRLLQALAPALCARRGGALVVLSVAAVGLSRSSPGYSASKAAALMLAEAARAELAAGGARLTVALPGFIDTEMSRPLQAPKAPARSVAERSLSGWLAGAPTVWPDRFAELVRDAVRTDPELLLDDPVAAMSAVHAAFACDAAAGT